MEPIHDVPVTIVTGFLGVGKTTAIRKLLAEREMMAESEATQDHALSPRKS